MNDKNFVPMVGATYELQQNDRKRLKSTDVGRHLTVTELHSTEGSEDRRYDYVHGTFSDGGTTKDDLGGVWFTELGKLVAHPFITKLKEVEDMSKFGFKVGDKIYYTGKYVYGLHGRTPHYEVVALDPSAMEFTIALENGRTQVRNDPHYFKVVPKTARKGYDVEVVEDNKDTKQTEGTFILWNPASDKAPKATYKTQEQALKVAESMARRYPGETFFVMRALSKSVVQLEVVTLDV